MRKTFALIAVVLFAIAGCKKPGVHVNGGYAIDSSFVINGLSDISLGYYDNEVVSLSLEPTGLSSPQLVSLRAEGQPEGVAIWFDQNDKMPPFTTKMTVANEFSKGGVYTVKIIGTTVSGKSKVYEFKLTTEPNNCSQYLETRLQPVIRCFTEGNTNGPSITDWTRFADGTFYYLALRNNYATGYRQVANAGIGVPVTLDCDAKTIIIPKTTIVNNDEHENGVEYTIWGEGTIEDDGIHILYHSQCKYGVINYELVGDYKW